MTREENSSPEANNNYLSASLEISKGMDGVCLAVLRWGDRAIQVEVELEQVTKKLSAYRTALEFFVDSLPEVDKSKNYELEQVGMANALWQAINQGSLADHLKELVNHSFSRPILLHVKTELVEHEVIPWELLGSPNCDFIKSMHITLSVCRSKPSPAHWKLSHSDKIKLLLANSQPIPIRAMHAGEEFEVIQGLLKENHKVEIVTLLNIDYHSFCKGLETQPQILHLACHGLDDKLVFKYEHGKQEIPHTSIVNAICDINSIGFVVLSVCRSANLARQLVESGIPAAIGMSTSITDFAAYEFSRWLYLGLQRGKTVCQSFQSAVDNLRTLSQMDRELWSIPVLYENQEFAPFVDLHKQTREESPFQVSKSTNQENVDTEFVAQWLEAIASKPSNGQMALINICHALLQRLKQDNELWQNSNNVNDLLLETIEKDLVYVRSKLLLALEKKHVIQSWGDKWLQFTRDIECMLDIEYRHVSFSAKAMKKFLEITDTRYSRRENKIELLEEQERLFEKYREFSLKYEYLVRRFSQIVEEQDDWHRKSIA